MATLTQVGNGTNKPGTKSKQGVRPRAAGKHDLELGKRIRLRRVEIGLSQDDLGRSLGVSFQQIQKYEKGVNRVSSARISEIAKALDVPIAFFYSEKDNKEREVESLLFLDSSFSLRLLRAYAKLKSQATQRSIVSMIEAIVAEEE